VFMSARVLLGVSAGIAAYKSCELLRLLTEAGHRVRVVPTPDALRFVGEATLNRFYILHCVAIPLVVAGLIAIHFWRVRKDGGISQPL